MGTLLKLINAIYFFLKNPSSLELHMNKFKINFSTSQYLIHSFMPFKIQLS